ncbi:hypothetical protein NQ318_006789 [Aromia moschata]|uniref:Uncharacterized protein n=1 Tax=Aromia moschata TaxID=1265417 RepID=A0AAV8XTL8_9CUCU|nr:hypothetical protein NQ318_006789 [Aromia moschata]
MGLEDGTATKYTELIEEVLMCAGLEFLTDNVLLSRSRRSLKLSLKSCELKFRHGVAFWGVDSEPFKSQRSNLSLTPIERKWRYSKKFYANSDERCEKNWQTKIGNRLGKNVKCSVDATSVNEGSRRQFRN